MFGWSWFQRQFTQCGCVNIGAVQREVVILGQAKILDLERDRLGRCVQIEVLPEVEKHVARRLVQRLQHSFQVPVDLYFGIDSGKEITKVGSLQHALSL